MDLSINILLLLFAFITTLVGIRGYTFDIQKRNLTLWGWVAFTSALLAFTFGGIKEYRTEKSSNDDKQRIIELTNNLDNAKKEIIELVSKVDEEVSKKEHQLQRELIKIKRKSLYSEFFAAKKYNQEIFRELESDTHSNSVPKVLNPKYFEVQSINNILKSNLVVDESTIDMLVELRRIMVNSNSAIKEWSNGIRDFGAGNILANSIAIHQAKQNAGRGLELYMNIATKLMFDNFPLKL